MLRLIHWTRAEPSSNSISLCFSPLKERLGDESLSRWEPALSFRLQIFLHTCWGLYFTIPVYYLEWKGHSLSISREVRCFPDNRWRCHQSVFCFKYDTLFILFNFCLIATTTVISFCLMACLQICLKDCMDNMVSVDLVFQFTIPLASSYQSILEWVWIISYLQKL